MDPSPVPSEPSARSAELLRFYRRRMRPMVEHWAPHGARLYALRAAADAAGAVQLRRKATTWPATYGGVSGAWLRAGGASARRGVLLHLHGGGFVFGSPRSHRALAYQLSRRSGMPVFVPHYRRAPKHPFPAAAEDCRAVYEGLLDRGIDAQHLRVSGDSAGGHLVAGLLGDAGERGLPGPAAALLFSPLLDLGCAELDERDTAEPDPFVSARVTRRACEAYLGGDARRGPARLGRARRGGAGSADAELAEGERGRADVLGAGKEHWPPTLIQLGATEALRGDAERLTASLRAAGVPCELQVWPGQIHVFQAWSMLPEAQAANQYAGEFLAGNLPRGSHSAGGSAA